MLADVYVYEGVVVMKRKKESRCALSSGRGEGEGEGRVGKEEAFGRELVSA